LTNSNYSKKQIEKITKKPIQVIPLGYNKPKKTINPHIKKEYVFIIGNKNPHKNLKKSIDLLKKYNLIYKKKYIPIYSLGKFSEEELAGIYKRAKFSFFLSEIEGFGLPLIESYSQETPVVFNNKTSLAELGKNLPGKCDVNNEISVFKAIEEIEKLNKIEIKQIKKELLKKYNWDKAIKEIENIFYNLIKNNN
jgi:glycosyltransferase involved in cell wall biosynthesis